MKAIWMITILWVVSIHQAEATPTAMRCSPSNNDYWDPFCYGSEEGGMLLTIHGNGFAEERFSVQPSTETANKVELVIGQNVYPCPVEARKTTRTQIACYTPPLSPGRYNIRIYSNGISAVWDSLNWRAAKTYTPAGNSTPQIMTISPVSGFPSRTLLLTGDFKTECYTTLDGSCEESRARISRIYIGTQSCEVVNPDTNELYENIRQDRVTCFFDSGAIGFFNISMIVTGNFGRSKVANGLTKLSGFGEAYHVETYAGVSKISPTNGSAQGGSKLRIVGNYFSNSSGQVVKVNVGNDTCNVISVSQTMITCQTSKFTGGNQTNFHGGRGLHIYKENRFVDLLSTTNTTIPEPTANSSVMWTSEASFSFNDSMAKTVWMIGYVRPQVNMRIRFVLSLINNALLRLSTDESPENMMVIASSRTPESNEINLRKNQNYYINLVASQSSGPFSGSIEGKMIFENTANNLISSGQRAKQRIQIGDDPVSEYKMISYNRHDIDLNNGEIQEIETVSAWFQLGFNGAYTKILPANAEIQEVESALNDLPTIYPLSVRVSLEHVSYRIIFPISMGNVSPLVLISRATSNPTNATEITQGPESSSHVAFELDGRITQYIDLSNINDRSSDINNKIRDLFAIRCPPSLYDQDSTNTIVYSNEFENGYTHDDSQISSDQCFCGRAALSGTTGILVNSNARPGQIICFAYKIPSYGSTNLRVYVGINADSSNTVDTIRLNLTGDNQWHYTCLDLLDTLEAINPSYYAAEFLVIRLVYINSTVNGLYDTVTLRTDFPPGYENDRITVNLNDQASSNSCRFPFTYEGRNYTKCVLDESRLPICGFRGNRKLYCQISSIVGVQRILPTRKLLADYLSIVHRPTENMITMIFRYINCEQVTIMKSHPSQSANITTMTRASSAISGTYNLEFRGRVYHDLPVQIEAINLKYILEESSAFGYTRVILDKACARYLFDIEWLSYDAQPLMTIVNSSNLRPRNTSIRIIALQNASFNVYQYKLPTNILRTYHTVPQVEVLIGEQPSRCTGINSDCSFIYLTEQTPEIFTLEHINETLSIIGNNLSSNNETVSVAIGNMGSCDVTHNNDSSIICRIKNTPCGRHLVRVSIGTRGLATFQNVSEYINVNMSVISIQPLQGSIQGGYSMWINGTGFSNDILVAIGTNLCIDLRMINTNSLTCQVPRSILNVGDQVAMIISNSYCSFNSSSNFNYTNTAGPMITGVVPSSYSVMGGTINVTGSHFGTEKPIVMMNNYSVPVLAWSQNHILAKVTRIPPGQYIISVNTNNNIVLSPVPFEIRFYIQHVYPQIGSTYGGTEIYVRGVGFDNKTRIEFVDDARRRTECPKKSQTENMIVCESPSNVQNVTITTNGIHPIYGIGWAWSTIHTTVEQGSIVTWEWTSPPRESSLKYQIQQVNSSYSTTPVENGFDSGSETPSGSFSFQFNKLGTYYYWSPNFASSSTDVFMRGVIQVIPARNRILTVEAVSDGLTAQTCQFPFLYEGVNHTRCINQSDADFWCSPTRIYTGQRLYCRPQIDIPSSNCSHLILNASMCDSTVTEPSKVGEYITTLCTVESVSMITPLTGTASTILSIIGPDFSGDECDYTINIESSVCSIINKNSTVLNCRIEDGSILDPRFLQTIRVTRKHQGRLILDEEFRFDIQPSIRNISPSSGSISGGTLVTIDGDNFIPSLTNISIGGMLYTKIINISNSQIKFITDARYNQTDQNLSLRVTVDQYPAVCRSSSCTFRWSNETTPYLTAVTPTTLHGDALIMITGVNLLHPGILLSDIRIVINRRDCIIMNVTNTSIYCHTEALEAGNHSVAGYIHGIGNMISSVKISSEPSVSSVSPLTSSIYGGAMLNIMGNGFARNKSEVVVRIGTSECSIVETGPALIQCTIPAQRNQSSSVTMYLRSGRYEFNLPFMLNYSTAVTPIVSDLASVNGSTPTVLIIRGSNFLINQTTVRIGKHPCLIEFLNQTFIRCQMSSNQSAGYHSVVVEIFQVGCSNDNQTYYQDLRVDNVTPDAIGFGGEVPVIITGHGFDGTDVRVRICDLPCNRSQVQSNSRLKCYTPQITFNNSDQLCNLTLNVDNIESERPIAVRRNLTATITSISPNRGGTGGGTIVTILGTNFPDLVNQTSVTIDNITCTIESINKTAIMCRTGSSQRTNLRALVRVFGNNSGVALNTIYFQYVDRWSSPWTWGGEQPPEAESIVSIEGGVTIYLDISTPILKVLIINGSTLIFDDTQDITLKAEYIIIVNNGHLQIGTESEPYQHRGVIQVFGHLRSTELPIYGAKVLALRNGTLDMHGKTTVKSWTQLSSTARPGSTIIELVNEIDWVVNSTIVIATTGNRFSQKESEVRRIVHVGLDNRTLTLDTPLMYNHLGLSQNINGTVIEMRAEVGLLSHNVVFEGSVTPTWDEFIEECPQQFNPDEFSIQTCFLGRYGSEVGSDQIGAMISASSGTYSSGQEQPIILRLSNVEIFHVGQAFRLNRYAINFDMNGNMSLSYIKSSSIYESYNRAVHISGSHGLTFENNVIYNIMGSAMVLSSGSEMNNMFKKNLIVFVKSSSSLQNHDLTPAAFWLTNPSNRLENNVVAGVSHYGYWYRLSNTNVGIGSIVIPSKRSLGGFINNSVHSSGRYGVWIYPEYSPLVSDSSSEEIPNQAVFVNLIAWRNRKGIELVRGSCIQILNALIFDNEEAGITTVRAYRYDDLNPRYYRSTFYQINNGSSIVDSTIIGFLNDTFVNSTGIREGLVVTMDRGLIVSNVTFINFPHNQSRAIGRAPVTRPCNYNCGGWLTKFSHIQFINVLVRGSLRWAYDAFYHDLDGSLTGQNESVLLFPDNFTRAITACSSVSEFTGVVKCPISEGRWVRMLINQESFNGITAQYLTVTDTRNNASIDVSLETSSGGNVLVNMFAVRVNRTYMLDFHDHSNIFNFRYTIYAFDLSPGDFLIFEHYSARSPRDGLPNISIDRLSNENSTHGWFYYDNRTHLYSFIMKNSYASSSELDMMTYFRMHPCSTIDCVTTTTSTVITNPPTINPNTIINPGYEVQHAPQCPIMSYRYWSNATDWTFGPQEYPNWNGTKPPANQNIYIPRCIHLYIDEPTVPIRFLRIDGVVEFQQGQNHEMRVSAILIYGGALIAGMPSTPFNGTVKIYMNGLNTVNTQTSEALPSIEPKMIGVYGRLDLNGRQTVRTWTRLLITAQSGDNRLILREAVDWDVGDEIVITTTDVKIENTERHRIARITNGTIIETVERLRHNHVVVYESLPNGRSISVAAAVGLLTHNVQIINVQSISDDTSGVRILIEEYITRRYYQHLSSYAPVYYKGAARLSNVQFIGFGKFSDAIINDEFSGLLLKNLGNFIADRETVVNKCSFDGGFNIAISLINTHNHQISNNVIYRTYRSGIAVGGRSNTIEKNLVTTIYWSGKAQSSNRVVFNLNYDAAIMSTSASTVIMRDNLVAGVDRLGYRIQGDACTRNQILNSVGHYFSNNEVHSAMSGVNIWPLDRSFAYDRDCVTISGFTTYKAWYYGFYINTARNIIIDSCNSIDSQVGIFTFILGPSPTTRLIPSSYVTIQNSAIIGAISNNTCSDDIDSNSINIMYSQSASPTVHVDPETKKVLGRSGIVFPMVSRYNKMPTRPWTGVTNYPALNGRMSISNTVFAYFNNVCNRSDVAIQVSQSYDDGQFPIKTSRIYTHMVSSSNIMFNGKPNLDKVNPSDCGDMDCDGLKKNLLIDTDGSLFGNPSSVISTSNDFWGDQRHGIGEFRIPRILRSNSSGHYFNVSSTHPYRGISRQSSCEYVTSWNMYRCTNTTDYRMLIFENMDSDSETRRISPVAVVSDSGFIDLINGPQDHGVILGYSSRRRLSTFMSLVHSNQTFAIYFTGSAPKYMRFRIVDGDSSIKLILALRVDSIQQVDVYANGNYRHPTNRNLSSVDLSLIDEPNNVRMNSTPGANYFDNQQQLVYFAIDGNTTIEVKISPSIILIFGFPPMTAGAFYASDLPTKLARLFGINPSKIRRTRIVEENSVGRRRRQIVSPKIIVDIRDEPQERSTESIGILAEILRNIAASVISRCQTGELFSAWAEANVTDGFVPSNISVQEPYQNEAYSISIVHRLQLLNSPSGCRENSPCAVQPVLIAYDRDGYVIQRLGSLERPWQIQATLMNQSNITIYGAIANYTNGQSQFNMLGLSSTGYYQLKFNFIQPDGTSSSIFQSIALNVAAQPMSVAQAILSAEQINHLYQVQVNRTFSISMRPIDKDTGLPLSRARWGNWTWRVNATLYRLPRYNRAGSIRNSNTTTVVINQGQTMVTLNGLSIDGTGTYVLLISMRSTNGEHSIELVSNAIRAQDSNDTTTIDTDDLLSNITFTGDFDSLNLANSLEITKAMIYNYLTNAGLQLTSEIVLLSNDSVLGVSNRQARSSVNQTTIVALFQLDTTLSNLTEALSVIQSDPNSIPDLTIRSVNFNGRSVPVTPRAADNGNHRNSGQTGLVVGLTIGLSILVFVIVVSLAAWHEHTKNNERRCKAVPMNRETLTNLKANRSVDDLRGFPEFEGRPTNDVPDSSPSICNREALAVPNNTGDSVDPMFNTIPQTTDNEHGTNNYHTDYSNINLINFD